MNENELRTLIHRIQQDWSITDASLNQICQSMFGRTYHHLDRLKLIALVKRLEFDFKDQRREVTA